MSDDKLEWTRLLNVMSLGTSTTAVASLIEAMTDPSESVRTMAALALGDAGDDAAIPALTQAAGDESPRVGKAAVVALGKIKGAA